MIREAYDKLDDIIMNKADSAMQAYNWVTGGTKKEVYHQLQNISGISFSTGAILISPFMGLITSPFVLRATHNNQRYFQDLFIKEENALEKGMLDPKVEDEKRSMKYSGIPISWCLTGASIPLNTVAYLHDNEMFIAGIMGLTAYILSDMASQYIARTTNLPPKKNCFRRGIDKLSDIAEKYKPKPRVATA